MIGQKRNRKTQGEKMKRKKERKKNNRRLIHVGIEERKTRLFAEIDRP